MSEFDRKLPANALPALERLTKAETDWWPDLLASWAPSGIVGPLRLAVRNGYMNFYAGGQSVAKVAFRRGGARPTLSIHHKYVIEPKQTGQLYIKLDTGEGCDSAGHPCGWGGPAMLERWICRSGTHRGFEKPLVEAIVAASPKIIDLEMGLPAYGDRKSALRMDAVALERAGRTIRIVFWEVKRLSDGRLRSRSHRPEVLEQTRAYQAYLQDRRRRERVIEAYRNNCRILVDLHKMAHNVAPLGDLDPLVSEAAQTDTLLDVEETPRLLIFDEGAKRDEDAWQEHLAVLRNQMSVAVVGPNLSGLPPIEVLPR